MDAIVHRFNGVTSIGCKAQLARARSGSQSILEVLAADALSIGDDVREHIEPVSPSACMCRISENGCIDPSECLVSHKLYSIPIITRWCDETTCRIRGGGPLILWSGWARPAAMKLLGRYASNGRVRSLVSRSHPRTLHTRLRFSLSSRHDPEINQLVMDIRSNKKGEKGFILLRNMNSRIRFGQHTLPREDPA